MKGLKWISTLTSAFGIIFVIYGFFQFWDSFSIEAPIRSYVFTIGGLILIIIGVSVHMIREQMQKLEINLIELTIKENRNK